MIAELLEYSVAFNAMLMSLRNPHLTEVLILISAFEILLMRIIFVMVKRSQAAEMLFD